MYTICSMDKNYIIKKIPRKLLNIINNFNESDKKARDFGTDEMLHLSEIHLIEFIGDNEKLSVSEIARRKNITRAAVSKTLVRLEDKKLIIKDINPDNRTQIIISLTRKGWTAYCEHKKYHENINKIIFSCVNNNSKEDINAIYSFLDQLENLL